MSDPADPRVTTTKGDPPPGTKAGPAPEPIDPETGQHGSYWVLTAEERAKGFVRPVRAKYVHTGIRPSNPTRPLTDDEKTLYGDDFVAFEPYPDVEERGSKGRFWTQAELDSGCGALTSMGVQLAETYAREPKFYGSTFCATCKEHFPVKEFTWDATDEIVGS